MYLIRRAFLKKNKKKIIIIFSTNTFVIINIKVNMVLFQSRPAVYLNPVLKIDGRTLHIRRRRQKKKERIEGTREIKIGERLSAKMSSTIKSEVFFLSLSLSLF